jgi:hypothetical protein
MLAESGCADARWLSVGLLNTAAGTYVKHFDDIVLPNDTPELSINSHVSSVVYFDPLQYDQVINEPYIFWYYVDDAASFGQNLQPWTGYGPVTYVDVCQ